MIVEVNLYIRQIKKGRLPKETVYDNLFRLLLNRGGECTHAREVLRGN